MLQDRIRKGRIHYQSLIISKFLGRKVLFWSCCFTFFFSNDAGDLCVISVRRELLFHLDVHYFFYSLLWTGRNLMHTICSHWMIPSLYMHCLQKVLALSGIPVAIGNRLLIMCIFYDVSIPNNYSSDCWCITFCMHWDLDVCFRERLF